MTISFLEIPINLRRPGVVTEVDPSMAQRGLQGLPHTALLVAQKLVAGTLADETLARVSSADQVRGLAGVGSYLHRMAISYFANTGANDAWIIAPADAGGAVAAAGTLTFSGPATAAGTIFLYVAGQRLTVAVASGDSAASIATAVVVAMGAAVDLPVNAAVNGGTPEQVDITAKHPGEVGNEIDLRLNYFDNEALPAGVGAVEVAMAGGSANPDLANTIAALGDQWFQVIACPYTDTPGLNDWDTELESRWGPLREIPGMVFCPRQDTHGDLLTFGANRNREFASSMGYFSSPSPPWEWAGAIAGRVAFEMQQDPARPMQTLQLAGILPPLEGDRFTKIERNLQLFDGIATFDVAADGDVQIERMISQYQTNAAGAPDTAFLDINTFYTLTFLRWSFRTRVALKFPRHKVADNGTSFGPGQAIVTPNSFRAELVALFGEWEDAGLVEGVEQFKRDLIVERNAGDPNRLDVRLPPDLVNQLRIVAAQFQFLL